MTRTSPVPYVEVRGVDAAAEVEGWWGPESTYAESVWLPVLGPASWLVWRRLALELLASPDGFRLELAALSAAVGLGSPRGRQSAIARTLRRLQYFRVAWRAPDDLLVVRYRLPLLTAGQLDRLHPEIQARHRQLCRHLPTRAP